MTNSLNATKLPSTVRDNRRVKVPILSLCVGLLFSGQNVPKMHAGDQAAITSIGKLAYVESTSRSDLKTVNAVEASADGKFVYASAWSIGSLNVFRRDAISGKLEHVQNLTDTATLTGCTCLALSPDGSYVVVPSFGSRSITLFRRNPEKGTLEKIDSQSQTSVGGEGLMFPNHAAFSPDSRFVYVSDSLGREGGCLTVFALTEDQKLKWVEVNKGEDRCFDDARGVAVHPHGKLLAVASSRAGTLVLLERDKSTGKTKVLQVLRGLEDDNLGSPLTGMMHVTFSPDGAFLYTSAGRFTGTSAVRAYKVDLSGKLKLIHELLGGDQNLEKFRGGNAIAISRDGLSIYAAATQSGALACFRRDPKTGKLEAEETLWHEDQRLAGAAGVAISPDGRFIYVAAENNQSIAVFQRPIK